MPNCVAYRSLTVPAKLLGVIINTAPFGHVKPDTPSRVSCVCLLRCTGSPSFFVRVNSRICLISDCLTLRLTLLPAVHVLVVIVPHVTYTFAYYTVLAIS